MPICLAIQSPISASISGFVHHDGERLSQYAVMEPAQTDDLVRGKRTVITIRQERIPVEKREQLQKELESDEGVRFSLLPLVIGIRVTDAAGTGEKARLEIPPAIICRRGIRVNLEHQAEVSVVVYPVPTIGQSRGK